MKSNLAIACLVLAASLTPVASFAEDGDSDRSNAVTFVKDSDITVKIKAQLAAEHITSLGRIHVDTDANGVVYLSGTARTQDAIDKAVSIAKKTERVTSVKSELTVRKDD
jgi:hyperosmotically inducible periplasmic protein